MPNFYPIKPGSVPLRQWVPTPGSAGVPRFQPAPPSNLERLAVPFSETGLTPRQGSVPDVYAPNNRAPAAGYGSVPRFVPQNLDLSEIFPDLVPPDLSTDPVGDLAREMLPDAPSWIPKLASDLAHFMFPQGASILDVLWMAFQLFRWWNREKHATPPVGSLVCGSGSRIAWGNIAQTWQGAQAACSNIGQVIFPWSFPNAATKYLVAHYDYTTTERVIITGVVYNGSDVPGGTPTVNLPMLANADMPGHKLYGQPATLNPGQVAAVAPGTAPLTGADPEAPPYSSLSGFDSAAQREASDGSMSESRSPWVLRQVGPAPGPSPEWQWQQAVQQAPLTVPQSQWAQVPVTDPWLPPQVAQIAQPDPSQTWREMQLEDQYRREQALDQSEAAPLWRYQPSAATLVKSKPSPWRLRPLRYGPPRKRMKEIKLRAPLALIHALAISTYVGGTIRNLWQSLPDQCKSKMHRNPRTGKFGKRRYDSMLSDVYKCLGHLDWGKFAILEGEMLMKYAAEGWALSQMNRITPMVGGGPMVGLGTQVMHNTGGLDYHGYDPQAGGAWAGRQSPLAPVDHLINAFNARTGANVYHPGWSWYGR